MEEYSDINAPNNVDILWNALNLGELLIDEKEPKKQHLSPQQQVLEEKYEQKIKKPHYKAVIDRYDLLPNKPKVIAKATLNRLADPISKYKYSIEHLQSSSPSRNNNMIHPPPSEVDEGNSAPNSRSNSRTRARNTVVTPPVIVNKNKHNGNITLTINMNKLHGTGTSPTKAINIEIQQPSASIPAAVEEDGGREEEIATIPSRVHNNNYQQNRISQRLQDAKVAASVYTPESEAEEEGEGEYEQREQTVEELMYKKTVLERRKQVATFSSAPPPHAEVLRKPKITYNAYGHATVNGKPLKRSSPLRKKMKKRSNIEDILAKQRRYPSSKRNYQSKPPPPPVIPAAAIKKHQRQKKKSSTFLTGGYSESEPDTESMSEYSVTGESGRRRRNPRNYLKKGSKSVSTVLPQNKHLYQSVSSAKLPKIPTSSSSNNNNRQRNNVNNNANGGNIRGRRQEATNNNSNIRQSKSTPGLSSSGNRERDASLPRRRNTTEKMERSVGSSGGASNNRGTGGRGANGQDVPKVEKERNNTNLRGRDRSQERSSARRNYSSSRERGGGGGNSSRDTSRERSRSRGRNGVGGNDNNTDTTATPGSKRQQVRGGGVSYPAVRSDGKSSGQPGGSSSAAATSDGTTAAMKPSSGKTGNRAFYDAITARKKDELLNYLKGQQQPGGGGDGNTGENVSITDTLNKLEKHSHTTTTATGTTATEDIDHKAAISQLTSHARKIHEKLEKVSQHYNEYTQLKTKVIQPPAVGASGGGGGGAGASSRNDGVANKRNTNNTNSRGNKRTVLPPVIEPVTGSAESSPYQTKAVVKLLEPGDEEEGNRISNNKVAISVSPVNIPAAVIHSEDELLELKIQEINKRNALKSQGGVTDGGVKVSPIQSTSTSSTIAVPLQIRPSAGASITATGSLQEEEEAEYYSNLINRNMLQTLILKEDVNLSEPPVGVSNANASNQPVASTSSASDTASNTTFSTVKDIKQFSMADAHTEIQLILSGIDLSTEMSKLTSGKNSNNSVVSGGSSTSNSNAMNNSNKRPIMHMNMAPSMPIISPAPNVNRLLNGLSPSPENAPEAIEAEKLRRLELINKIHSNIFIEEDTTTTGHIQGYNPIVSRQESFHIDIPTVE